MSTETNETIVKRFIEAANARDVARLHEILTPELADRWRQSVLPWLHGTFAGHTMTINGYPDRGNPILGLVREGGDLVLAGDGLPYTTLQYANGPGDAGPCSAAAS